ncbi:MAG: histidinol-phosphatase, partial [Paludibacteraceae bacterium]|nr:histidinol-phosphatase [Paludibacteraceae bacterium]
MNYYPANYHTHSLYCDGKSTLEEQVHAAEQCGLLQLGFSSHAPVPFENNFAMAEEKLPDYIQEIDRLQQTTLVTLLKSLECDYIPEMTVDFAKRQTEDGLDYVIGGVHQVRQPNGEGLWFIDGSKQETYDNGLRDLFDMNIKKAVTTFWEQTFEMIETQQMDIIAHFDKIKMHNRNRFFTEDESWYKILADKAIQLIKRHNLIIEVNTRGLYKKRSDSFYPSTELLMKARKADIPVIVSSDAHKAEELMLFVPEALEELQRCG